MIGLDVLLGAALEAGLGLLAQAGLGDELSDLKNRLTRRTEKARRTAFDRAFDRAAKRTDEKSLRPLLNSAFFREAVVAGLLDPVQGFDVQSAARVWDEQLPAHAPAIRRFFSALEVALFADETWGPILERYQALRYRQDVLAALQKRGLNVPSKELVATLSAELSGGGAIAQEHSAAAGAGGIAVGRDVLGGIVHTVIERLVVERVEWVSPEPGPQPDAMRAAYLNRLCETTGSLSLAGIDPKAASQSDVRLNLGAVYTALLTLTPEAQDRAMLGETIGRDARRLSALAQLNHHRRLVLLGDPGSGKSTFVNFVATCLAGEALRKENTNLATLTAPLPDEGGEDQENRQPWEHGALLPVRVILREFAARGLPAPGERATAEHLWRYIVADLEASSLGDYAQALRQEWMEQGGLLLLDGLDEVPEANRRRAQIKQAVEEFCSVFSRCRVLATSRTYAYQNQDWKLNGFAESVLAPFSAGQVRRFVDRWYAHIAVLRNLHLDDAQGRAELLKRAIFGSDRLWALAERPLLLTLMASLHAWRGGSLPEKREELYADAVDLLLDWWESPKSVRDAEGEAAVQQPSLVEWLKVDRARVRGLLNELAYDVHAAQPDLVDTADLPESELVHRLMQLSRNPDVRPGRLVEYLSQRAGLLLPRGVGVFTFPHRTIQEYLAACHLTDHDYPELVADLARKNPNRWQEVALLAGAKAARGTASAIWQLADALCYCAPQAPGVSLEDAWGAHLAAQALVESADLGRVSDRNRAKVARVRGWLARILGGDELPAVERVAAGDALSQLGDPRFRAAAWYLPDEPLLGFVEVPGGPFRMGSDKGLDRQAYDDETSRHPVVLPTYYIARYPVTVAQFQAFVEESGQRPGDPESLRGVPNHPVVRVTWYETVAYCRWLTEKLRDGEGTPALLAALLRERGWRVRLPSEAEWEKAARGEDGRIYPWGDEPDPERANYDDTGIGATSAVGCFPGGASPYGVLDLSGNVWEWTRSLWGKDLGKPDFDYPYDPQDGREDESAGEDVYRVLRGGAFNDVSRYVRCAFRDRFDPVIRDGNGGFRVVLSPG